MSASSFIIPILLIVLLIFAAIKKVNCFQSFINGASGAVKLCLSILPFLVTIFLMIELFKVSGLSVMFAKALSPIFSVLGIPNELCELVLLRPFSGSASLAVYEDILLNYGADSYISRSASVIMGSSETVFYVATIYISGTKVKKLLYAIPVALFACLCGAIAACLLCKIM